MSVGRVTSAIAADSVGLWYGEPNAVGNGTIRNHSPDGTTVDTELKAGDVSLAKFEGDREFSDQESSFPPQRMPAR